MPRNEKSTKPQTLPEFKPSNHYAPGIDIDLLNEDNNTISPTPAGIELIAQYYARKYGTNIVHPNSQSMLLRIGGKQIATHVILKHLPLVEIQPQ